MNQSKTDDSALNVADAAAFLGYSKATLNRWRWKKTGPSYVKISRNSVRYRLKDLKRWLSDRIITNKRK